MPHFFPPRRSSERLEAARDQVEAHRVGDRIAEAAEERERLRIHRLALRQVDPDRAPLAVAEKPAQFVSRADRGVEATGLRSEEHTSELQSLMRISYAVFCLKKKQ